MNATISKLEQFVWEKLFYSGTNLIYDVRLTSEPDGLLVDLPTPEEISRNFPNSCSWKTGMENSMLNAGLMLDAVLLQYQKTANPAMRELADKLYQGIKLCATVSGVEGFLARSVSPFDGKSYYFDSSRDQYTHIVYSLYHYLNSDLCEDKQGAKDILRSFAVRAYRNISKDNNYDMLRADGKPGFVSKMWGNLAGHEFLRLPMIYLAAHAATGEEIWKKLYLEFRDEAIERSYTLIDKSNRLFIYSQMQLSVRLLYELDEEYREQYSKLMRFVVDTCAPKLLERAELIKAGDMHLDKPFLPWRSLPCSTTFELGELEYRIPDRDKYEEEEYWPFMDVADVIIAMALCPDCEISAQYRDTFFEIAAMMDMEHQYTEVPIRFITAYWNLVK